MITSAVLTHLVVRICHKKFPVPFPASCEHCWSQWGWLISEDTFQAFLISVVSEKLRWQKEEMDSAQAELSALKRTEEDLKQRHQKLEEKSENNDIDEVIIPTAPLYKQILNLYIEENAIEDSTFYLGGALRQRVIDLHVFLKHVFCRRALMQSKKECGSQ